MEDTNNASSAIASVLDFAKEHFRPADGSLTVNDPYGAMGGASVMPYLITPSGMMVHDLAPAMKAWRDLHAVRPARRTGTAVLGDLASFVGHVSRFCDEHTIVFAEASRTEPKLLAVYDYHKARNMPVVDDDGVIHGFSPVEGTEPRWGGHRASYAFPLSEEWKAWLKQDKLEMGQAEFAQFVEDHILDVLAPPPAVVALAAGTDPGVPEAEISPPDIELAGLLRTLQTELAGPAKIMQMSRGLAATVDMRYESKVDLQTGASALTFMADVNDAEGKKLSVPGMFLVAIPVFHGGGLFRLAVRLRVKPRGSSVKFSFELFQPYRTFDTAFKDACRIVAEQTTLPVLIGKPEGA